MDELMRFIALRPAQNVNAAAGIDMTAQTPLQSAIRRILSTVQTNRIFAHAQSVTRVHVGTVPPVSNLASLTFAPNLLALRNLLRVPNPARNLAGVEQDIATTFGTSSANVAANQAFEPEMASISDAILASFLLPEFHSLPLSDLVDAFRMGTLLRRVSKTDATLNSAAAFDAALSAPLLLPSDIFPPRPDQIQPVGVADLKVVRDHLKRYELGALAGIENILAGEKRERTVEDSKSTSRQTTTTTERSESQESELDTTQRFDLKREISNSQKEDIAVKGGVSASYKYGDTLTINANVDTSYSNSKEQATKQSQEYAKEITQRAISKVTSSLKQTVTTRVRERHAEREVHTFNNEATGSTTKPVNINGIYQWVNQVFEAQIFNYGRRLLFDIIVPEPAALLIEAATTAAEKPKANTLSPPDPLVIDPKANPLVPLTPSHLNLNPTHSLYYGKLLTKYQVTNAKAPKAQTITISKSVAGTTGEALAGDITIPDGYAAKSVNVVGVYNYNDSGSTGVNVFVGKRHYGINAQNALPVQGTADDEVISIAYGIETDRVSDYALTIDVTCALDPTALEQWRLDTFNAIVTGYKTLLGEYEDGQLNQLPKPGVIGSIGGNPDLNKELIQAELKRAAISMLANKDLVGATNGIQVGPPPGVKSTSAGVTPPAFSRPLLPPASGEADFIRFWEQAFEWEQLTYFCYPYYWAREWTWLDKMDIRHSDARFEKFLKAGAARVVIPVRPSMENDLRYFLITGQIWQGGTMPAVTDSNYLPITEEIRESETSSGQERPDGPSWEFTVPTSIVKLRTDGALPGWVRANVWDWTAQPKDA